jgi:hypothetical protein
MRPRRIAIVLLAVNLGLLGIVIYMAYLLRLGPIPSNYFTRPRVITNTVTQIAVRKINATNLLAALGNRPLHWSALESTNYSIYMANLRAIGCPEETLRDIILTDVAKLYAKRRSGLRSQGQPAKFWQTGDAWENGYASNPVVQKQLKELDREERALVQELLGVDYQTEIAKYFNEDNAQERLYGFLPQEKRDRVMGLQSRFDELEQEVYGRSKGVMLEEDQEQLRQIQKQREEEMAKVMTPEEKEEYDLRNSSTANNMRTQMSGFEPSEEEFRKIFRLQKTFDNEFNQIFDSGDEAQMEIKAKAQQGAQEALNDEVKKVLGEPRFAEYQRAQDGDYKALVQITDRFEVPRDVADKVYNIKVEAERQKQRIESNPNITEEQQQRALAAIAQETERTVAQTMGPTFKAYQKSGAQWIRNLNTMPEGTGSEIPVSTPPPLPQPFPFPPLPVPVVR